MKRYYSLYKQENTAEIYIYGDITSWPWSEDEVSSYNLSKELQELEDVDEIKVYINSYGGEVKEGLAIYNSLKRHKAKITTIADGFACSIASVIFAAGDERIVSNTSMLMIHNAWTYASGDSNDLRKQAEDLEKITQASVNAYMNIVNIEEEELKEMMNTDTWLNGDEALEVGFATKVIELENKAVATQSIREKIVQNITKEPEKVAVANVSFDEDKLEEIVKSEMKKFKEELQVEVDKKEEKNIENKPLNVMRAFFNLEGENNNEK